VSDIWRGYYSLLHRHAFSDTNLRWTDTDDNTVDGIASLNMSRGYTCII